MSVITISKGTYSRGGEVAEKLAQRLGYDCVGREVILEASDRYNVPEIHLVRVVESRPSIIDVLKGRKREYVAYIKATLLERLRSDNVVYHGFAGHLFAKDISHVLKVRVLAATEQRVAFVKKRDGIADKEALRLLRKIDEQRSQWSAGLYGVDVADAGLYDLTVQIDRLSCDEAVEIIEHTVNLAAFRTTEASARTIDDLALTARVEATMTDIREEFEIHSEDGVVFLKVDIPEYKEVDVILDMKERMRGVPGVKEVRVQH